MSVSAARSCGTATAALAREPGEAADLTDALLEVRSARERLRRVDSLLAALLAEVRALARQERRKAGR